MENSFLAIFNKIWPKDLYMVFGPISEQLQKNLIFDWNQLKVPHKLSTLFIIIIIIISYCI